MESTPSQRKDPERADPITRVIASRVAELRNDPRRKMSGAKLGAAVRELGVKGWVGSTVGKLETLRRESVTVTELLALAHALGVPPVLLLADLASGTPVPIAGSVELDPWSAVLWFIGRNSDYWTLDSLPIRDAMKLVELSDDLNDSRAQALSLEFLPDDPSAEERRRLHAERDRATLRHMAYVLRRFPKYDPPMPPPQLPAFVFSRAAELGVELPRVAVDDEGAQESR